MTKDMMLISRHRIRAQLTVVNVIIWLYRLLPKHPCLHENITLSRGEICTNALISSGNFQNDNQIHEGSKLLLFTHGIWCVSNPHGILVSSSFRCKNFSQTSGGSIYWYSLCRKQCDCAQEELKPFGVRILLLG